MTVSLSPALVTGYSGEDAIELLCVVTVMEDIIETIYQFAWTKDENSVGLSSDRIQVLILSHIM